jgi:adenosylcobinamide-phosphate synthase
MIGHKNEKYKDFGWFSARLDDTANLIPARISGLLIAASSSILGKNFKNSLITMIKDGNKHPSPNAGFPEAAMAGALGIRLGGPSAYQGKVIVKPYLGGEKRPVEPSCINEALTISLVASIFMVFIGVFLKWII